MAEKRMFSNKITQSDPFLTMPASAQNLYFHLSMDADDDGFVNRPKSIMRMVNANEDDLNILVAKNFVIPFEVKNHDTISTLICVIKHWFIHNTIRGDRKKGTTYIQQKNMLFISENGSYSLKNGNVQPSDNQVATNSLHSIDKISIEENSIDKNNKHNDSEIKMPLRDGNEFIVQSSMIKKWKEAYTQLNVDIELKKMTAWLISNPTKQKTKSGMNKFINNWLSRNNDKLEANTNINTKTANRVEPVQPTYSKSVEVTTTQSRDSFDLEEWYKSQSEGKE